MLFDKETYVARRSKLKQQVKEGLILLFGNNEAPANYPANAYKYRQDSCFLYFYGQHREGLAGVIDVDNDRGILLRRRHRHRRHRVVRSRGQRGRPGRAKWRGRKRADGTAGRHRGRGTRQGAENPLPAPYRHDLMIQLMDLTGIHPARQREEASVELIRAVIDQRAVKSPAEIEEIERACAIGHEMHTTAMRLCRPGVTEQFIAGTISGIASAKGCMPSFPTILSMHGGNHARLPHAAPAGGRTPDALRRGG